MTKLIIFVTFLLALSAIVSAQYFASSQGVEFPRYGKRSDLKKETIESAENDKPSLHSLLQKSLDKNHEQLHLKKLTKDNLIRQILLEYLLNGQNENE